MVGSKAKVWDNKEEVGEKDFGGAGLICSDNFKVKSKVQMSPALERLFWEFTHLPLGGKKVRCPYWMDKINKKIFGPFGGKGTPKQILKATSYWAQKEGLDLNKLSAKEIHNFMKRKRIGIDCSGFVYRMLGALAKEKKIRRFKEKICGVRGRVGARHVNVDCLTNDVNTRPVENIEEIKVGDLIRMKDGSHVAIVVKIQKEKGEIKEVVYAHSSRGIGPHLGKIQFLDPKKGLEFQIWLEKTKTGKCYGKYLRPKKGDGLRRLKIWA